MRKPSSHLQSGLVLGFCVLGIDLQPAPASAAEESCALAIVNVHVVSMAQPRVTPLQTVRIRDGRISSIESKAKDKGRGCRRVIDGGGKYLLPGLNDMHVHVETNAFTSAFGLPPARIDYEAALALYLAHGVTGVRVLSGAPDLLAFRNKPAGATVPRLVISSPMLSGSPPVLPEPLTRVVEDEASARTAVTEFLDKGYDLIKIRSNLSEEAYRAVLDETDRRGSYVDGHVTRGVGLEGVLTSGQRAFAHLDELAMAVKGPGDLERIVEAVRSCACFVNTTLSVTRNIFTQLRDYDGLLARPEMQYLHPVIVDAFWRKPHNPYLAQDTPPEIFKQLHEKTKTLLKALIDAGAAIVSGTDAMNPMIIPGASLHDELAAMVEAGLTPYEAIRTSTTEVARSVPGFEDVGLLEPGRAATAILIPENPLKDVSTLRRPEAVMLDGEWLDQSVLGRLLEKAAGQGRSK